MDTFFIWGDVTYDVLMEREQSQIAVDITKSRVELGMAAIHAAGRNAITIDEAKALNLHLGVSDPKKLLAHDKRKKKAEYLEGIAEAVRLRRLHFETHKLIPMSPRLAETTMLALAVGEQDDSDPLDRLGLLKHSLVIEVSARRKINSSIVIDQMVINDLLWLSASTEERRQR